MIGKALKQPFIEFLEGKEIIANIKPNPRNREATDVYFDEGLYKNRFKIEQANGWLDGYKELIIRYEYLDITWNASIRIYIRVPQKSLNTFIVQK